MEFNSFDLVIVVLHLPNFCHLRFKQGAELAISSDVCLFNCHHRKIVAIDQNNFFLPTWPSGVMLELFSAFSAVSSAVLINLVNCRMLLSDFLKG